MKNNITVDVIIPTYRPGKEFATLVQRLVSQSLSVHKIIIMNTEESLWDKTISEEFPFLEVHHLSRSEFDHGGTRSRAAQLSDADIMVFMTQDAMPEDDSLVQNLVQPLLENEQAGAAYARQLPNKECSFVESYTRSFNYPDRSSFKTTADLETYGIKTFFCSNVCAAYKKSIYRQLGGFVPRTIFNEDMIYAGRLIQSGYGIIYAADARVIHSHNYSCIQQFHRNFDLGVSQAEHPEIFEGIPSESEGMRLVKKTFLYLLRTGRIWLIPGFVLQSGFKYAGYLCGKKYQKLPQKIILKCTMNKEYWKH